MIRFRRMSAIILIISVGIAISSCSSSDLNTREREELSRKLRITPFKEVSIENIITQSKFKMEDIYIESFNVAVNSEGYIESLNIVFTQIDTPNEFILMYRRESRLFKIIEQNQELEVSQLSNSSIITVIDEKLIPLININKSSEATIITLMAPTAINLSVNTGYTYYNGTLLKGDVDERIKGIAFYVYKKPIEENDELIKYIFDHDVR